MSASHSQRASQEASSSNTVSQEIPRLKPTHYSPPVSAHDYAYVLGILDETPEGISDELHRNRLFNDLYQRHTKEATRAQADRVFCEFCALYTPKVVERFICLNQIGHEVSSVEKYILLNNAYSGAFGGIMQSNPYFWKYLGSGKIPASNNKQLVIVCAERLLTVLPIWDQFLYGNVPLHSDRNPEIIDAVLQVLELFSVLTLSYGTGKHYEDRLLPSGVQQSLKSHLSLWQKSAPKISLRHKSMSVIALITGNRQTMKDEIKKSNCYLLPAARACALYGCKAMKGLRVCSRCQTAKYCSKEHQTLHWNHPTLAHKDRCFQTDF